MKKSKFLVLTPCVAIATVIPFTTSCNGKHEITIESIEDAIFHPIESKQIVEATYVDQLKKASSEDLQKELIYRIYAPNESWFYNWIETWYKEKLISLVANIQTCQISFEKDTNNVLASFAGYINFVFIKDFYDDYHKDDIVQITYLFDNLNVTPDEGTWFLKFELPTQQPPLSFGFIEIIKDGERNLPIPITSLNPREDCPNWHNWYN